MQYRDGVGYGEDRRDARSGENNGPPNFAYVPVSRQDGPQRATSAAVLFFKRNLRFANELVDRAPNIETGEIRQLGSVPDVAAKPALRKRYRIVRRRARTPLSSDPASVSPAA